MKHLITKKNIKIFIPGIIGLIIFGFFYWKLLIVFVLLGWSAKMFKKNYPSGK